MRWTRKGIIEEIRRLHAAGEELNYKTVEENHLNLVRAASWHFGTWKRAIEKAGLDYDDVSKYQKWSRERVVERIQELYRQGKDLSWRSISTEVDPPLAAAALRENSGFESWFEAITAAGLNHDEIARYRRWSRERVLEEIMDRHKNGLPMSSIAVQRQNSPLYCAAKRRFLQWDSALAAAGLDPNKIRIRKAPDAPKPRRRRGDNGQLTIPEMEAAVPLSLVRPARRRRNGDIPTLEEAVAMAAPVKKGRGAAKAAPAIPAASNGGRARKAVAETAAPAEVAPVVEAALAKGGRKAAKTPVVATPAPEPKTTKGTAKGKTTAKAPEVPAVAARPAAKSKAVKAPEPAPVTKTGTKSKTVKAAEPAPTKAAAKSKAAKTPEPVAAPAKAAVKGKTVKAAEPAAPAKAKAAKAPEPVAPAKPAARGKTAKVPVVAEAPAKPAPKSKKAEPVVVEEPKAKKAKGKEKDKGKDKAKAKKKK